MRDWHLWQPLLQRHHLTQRHLLRHRHLLRRHRLLERASSALSQVREVFCYGRKGIGVST